MSTSNAQPARSVRYAEAPVQKAAAIVGAVFIVVGIAGFIPGLTTDVGSMTFSGHESGAMLLGLFQVSILHNFVHLLFGLAGLLFATTFAGARGYLIWGGVVYGLLLVYGLVVSGDHPANFVPLNEADNWLHAAIAVGMILLGVLLGRRSADRAPASRRAAA